MELSIEYTLAMTTLIQGVIDNNREKLSSQDYQILSGHNQYIIEVLNHNQRRIDDLERCMK
jgi:hypothetical protein